MPKSHVASARLLRKRLVLGMAVLTTAALSVGVTMAAEASGGGSTTNVKFVPLAPPFKLETNHAMTANSTLRVAIIGGATTVPYNATTVELNVTATSAAGGVMNFYPSGNTGGGSGQYLSWSAGGSDTQTIQENVGTKDQLAFALEGGAATLTATITGYSTQVTDGDISPADGTTGQVLTNTGSGAAWQNVGAGAISGAGGSAGQVLTNTGTGAAWQAPGGAGYETDDGCCTHFHLGASPTAIVSLTLPAGSYELSFATGIDNTGSSTDTVECYVQSPLGPSAAYPANAGDDVLAGEGTNMTISGLVSTSGGKFTAYCDDSTGATETGNYQTKLIATQLSSETGGASG